LKRNVLPFLFILEQRDRNHVDSATGTITQSYCNGRDDNSKFAEMTGKITVRNYSRYYAAMAGTITQNMLKWQGR
jgi:hypothetical protein